MDRLSRNPHLQTTIPALALLRADPHSLTPVRETRKMLGSLKVVDLQEHCGSVASTLHLVYEVCVAGDQIITHSVGVWHVLYGLCIRT